MLVEEKEQRLFYEQFGDLVSDEARVGFNGIEGIATIYTKYGMTNFTYCESIETWVCDGFTRW